MDITSRTIPTPPRTFAVIAVPAALLALFALAMTVAGALPTLPRPLMPLLILSPVIAGALAYRRSAAVRAAVTALPTRGLVAFHGLRLPIGVAFLLLHAGGQLPSAFALPAGVGDIIAGGLALALLPWATLTTAGRRRALLAWNVLALLDIVMVIVTAQRLILFEGDVTLLGTMGRMPWGLIPLFIVPLVFLTHLAIFARLLPRRASA